MLGVSLETGLAGLAALVVLAGAGWLIARNYALEAAPDQWALLIRNGRLVRAGVGISLWRRPGDGFAVFSSTLQRVGFELEALSQESLSVKLRGFMFWSVSPKGDGPFRAFRLLGLANLLRPPKDLKHPQHLLTTPQHKALQQIVLACVQRLVGTLPLDALLMRQDEFVLSLAERLRLVFEPLGAEVGPVQVLEIGPADPKLAKDLGAGEEEKIREAAAALRMETADRMRQHERELATRQARQEADAQRDRQAHEAQTLLELEQQRASLLERQQEARLLQMESEAAVRRRTQQLERERALLEEERELAILESRLERQRQELSFECEKAREQAEARRDAGLMGVEIEERKTQAVRDYELGRLAAETLGKSLKISDARWVQVGAENPLAGVGGLLASVQEIISRKS